MTQGSFNTLQKICEDAPHKLDFQVQGRDLLDHLVPQFIEFTNHNVNKVRLYALQILQSLLSIGIAAVTANIDNYIRALFNKASDPSPDIRKSVCASLGLILGSRPDKLVPEMGNVVDYIVFCTQDDDETVALEASEFWLTFAEDASLKDQLRPYLPKIAPLLLNKMVYSDYDIAVLDMDEYDEDVADKETDIKPRNYSSKVHAAHETNDPSSSKGAGFSREAADRAFEEDEEEDDEEDDEFFDDEDGTGEWNIRKCSAATLDVLAVSFGAELLEILLPHLRDKIFDAEWQQRESGVLALGAIAEGKFRILRIGASIDSMQAVLPVLSLTFPNLSPSSSGLSKTRRPWCDRSPVGLSVATPAGSSKSTLRIKLNTSSLLWKVSSAWCLTTTSVYRKRDVLPLPLSRKRPGPRWRPSWSRFCET